MKNKVNDISYPKYLFHRGENYESYKFLGAFYKGPGKGTLFRVWAPHAEAVSLVWAGNDWEPGRDPMTRRADDDSLWEIFMPGMEPDDTYKYAVTGKNGATVLKADPYALKNESGSGRNQKASIITDRRKKFRWHDQDWLAGRAKKDPCRSPMLIYEAHMGSWKRHEDGSYYNYRETARELIPYLKKMGYTHIELMPISEYPLDGSWGYQVTGYFSVTSRFGSPEDLKYFIDQAHKAGISVIVDWVPAHFPKDAFGLIEFDGAPLYEDSNPFRMEHKGWGTRAFDFGRPEVLSFLISNAHFLCDEFHADGIRVDAISAMLYLDYDRKDGEWMQNQYGGKENIEAIGFLRSMNEHIHIAFPGVITVAEESTAWPMVTKPPKDGGLGFNFKWNMGWMNDTLSYFGTDMLWRGDHHYQLTFSLTYAYSENFILPVSHDEVVHLKRSLLRKMPGDPRQQLSGDRAFFVYFMTHPGKKLSFMGNEFGQLTEWDESRGLDWAVLGSKDHQKLQTFIKELNKHYLELPQLWAGDDRPQGFSWIDADNKGANVYSYYRVDPDHPEKKLLVVLNLSGLSYPEFDIGVPGAHHYRPLIDSDALRFGGSGMRRKRRYKVMQGSCNYLPQHITMPLPALSGIILISEEETAK